MKSVPVSHGTKDKVKFVFLSFILLGMTYVIYTLGLVAFFRNIALLNQQSIAIAVSNWAVPMAIAGPSFLILAIGLWLKLMGKDNGRLFACIFNLVIGFGLVAIVVRLPIGFFLDNYLEERGYSKCIYYTSPANFSPTAWVRSPEYCVEQTGPVRRPLMEWLQAQPNGGKDVSAAEVREKALGMLDAYKAGERFLD